MEEFKNNEENIAGKKGFIEKKFRDTEKRVQDLTKRVSEKDKNLQKMRDEIDGLEEKRKLLLEENKLLTENYEKKLAELKMERDTCFNHFKSLEATYADLSSKYDKTQEMSSQLKKNIKNLSQVRKGYVKDFLSLSTQIDKMKSYISGEMEKTETVLQAIRMEHLSEISLLKAQLPSEKPSDASFTIPSDASFTIPSDASFTIEVHADANISSDNSLLDCEPKN